MFRHLTRRLAILGALSTFLPVTTSAGTLAGTGIGASIPKCEECSPMVVREGAGLGVGLGVDTTVLPSFVTATSRDLDRSFGASTSGNR